MVVISFLLGWLCAPALAQEAVALTIYPRYTAGYRPPVYVRASWRIPQQDDNRWWSLAWSNLHGGLSGATYRQMEGAHAAVSYQQFVEVGGGRTVFECCVYRATGRRVCDDDWVEVIE